MIRRIVVCSVIAVSAITSAALAGDEIDVGAPAIPAATESVAPGAVHLTADADTTCSCPHQGDIAPFPAGDGVVNVLDVIQLISCIFLDCLGMTQDPECPTVRGDVAATEGCTDGLINVFDAVRLIDYVFRSGPPLCDPCSP